MAFGTILKKIIIPTSFLLIVWMLQIAQAAPGGVTGNLTLWLKANAGVTGATPISDWADQSGNANNYTSVNPGNALDQTTNTINGNPVVILTRNGTLNGPALQVPNGIAFFTLRGDNPTTSSFLFDDPGELAFLFEQRVDSGSPGVTVFASGSLPNPNDYIAGLVNTPFDEVGVLSFERLTANSFYTIQSLANGTRNSQDLDTFNTNRYIPLERFGGGFSGHVAEIIIYSAH